MKKINLLLFLVFVIIFVSSYSAALIHPKTGNSDTYPKIIVMSNGYYQCRYNIQKVEKTDESGTRIVYNYDYIELKLVYKDSVIWALIENGYEGYNADEIADSILNYLKEIN